MKPLTVAERELLARAVVYTRVSAFTDPERLELTKLVGQLSETWDRTQGAFKLLPNAVKRRARKAREAATKGGTNG